jgi:hypothetical protein
MTTARNPSRAPHPANDVHLSGPEFARRCNCCLASAACHLAAMIALGIAAAVGAEKSRPLDVIVHLEDGNVASDAVSAAEDHVVFHSTSREQAPSAGPVRLFEEFASAASYSDSSAPPAPFEMALLESGRGGTIPDDFGVHSADFAKRASQFFGVTGYGNSIVYVVDCSGSMGEMGKLERAKYELLHSLEQLTGEQKFFVIFYSDGAYPMEGNAPVGATNGALQKTRRWIDSINAQGSTNPQPALFAALSLKPDTIYFLSDGLFDAGTIAEVRRVNRRRQGGVPIHTIAFVSRENVALMRAIARDSGGEFRFVP